MSGAGHRTPSGTARADVVIVGGGSAGCVLANRLSADGRRRVVLLEAGPDTPPGAVPADVTDLYPIRAFYNRAYFWPPFAVTLRDGRPATYEQARIMGGGSTVNGMMALRGLPSDYDAWAAAGCTGWSWADMLPAFRRLECDALGSTESHGGNGPIAVTRPAASDWSGFSRAAAAALGRGGLDLRADHNADFGDGTFPLAVSASDGGRVSAAMGYLDAATRARENLVIRAGTTVRRILFEGRRATGVELDDGQVVAGDRIVVCAGALQSPVLLMRSGIGDGAALSALGVAVVADVPGVGRNLNEHPVVAVAAHLRPAARLDPAVKRHIHVLARYSSGLEGCPAGDMLLLPVARAGWHALGRRLASTLAWVNHPFSRGSVRLAADRADGAPRIDFALLSDPRDRVRLADGFRRVAALYADPAVAAEITHAFPAAYGERVRRYFRVSRRNAIAMHVAAALVDLPATRRLFVERLAAPGPSLAALLRDPVALEDWLVGNVTGGWHASGTCRMGADDDPGAVVDARCAVRGVVGLHVVDASVMPFVPSANTNIPTIAVAERAAILLSEADYQ